MLNLKGSTNKTCYPFLLCITCENAMYKKKSITRYKIILRGLAAEKSFSQICQEADIASRTLYSWCEKNPKLKERVKQYKISAYENALQLCALGGFRTKLTKEYNKDGSVKKEYESFAPPNIAAIIFALCNKDPDNWKNNRDKFGSSREDELADTTYEILTTEDKEKADELLKQFTGGNV